MVFSALSLWSSQLTELVKSRIVKYSWFSSSDICFILSHHIFAGNLHIKIESRIVVLI